jgi:hypothetical protein
MALGETPMDPYEALLSEWLLSSHYEQALRRVTRCAGGDVHQAEDAISEVLRRMLANRTYQHTDMAGLTAYIVQGARREVWGRPSGQSLITNPDAMANVGQAEASACAEARELFEELVPCLSRLNATHTIAVVHWLEEVCDPIQPCTATYVPRSLLHEWLTARKDGTRRQDRHRGLKALVRCLWRRGWDVERLIDFTEDG